MTKERLKAVLLDLDDTLVITSASQALARASTWSAAFRAFGETALAPGVVPALAHLVRRARVGVVTSSQRRYADGLLGHHQLNVPVLVAFEDVQDHKPSPEPIRAALYILGVEPWDATYIGDSEDDKAAARAAGVSSLTVCWTVRTTNVERRYRTWADVVVALGL